MTDSKQLLASAQVATLKVENRALRLRLAAAIRQLRHAAASLQIAADVIQRIPQKKEGA